MLEAIRGAERTVDLMTFVYWQGDIAVEFAEAMGERAQAGVRVRLLIDALGGRLIDKTLVDAMDRGRRAGRVVPQAAASSRRSSPTTGCTARSASSTAGSPSPAASASPRSGAATRATRASGATPTCASRARRSTGCSRRSSRTGPRPAARSTTSDDEFPEQPQRGGSTVQIVRGLGVSLGWDDMQSAFHVMLGVGAGAAAHRHRLLRAGRRLPRRPSAPRPRAASRSTCCCPARTPTSGSASWPARRPTTGWSTAASGSGTSSRR